MAFDCSLPVQGTTASVALADTAPSEAARLVPVAAGESGPELPVTSLTTEGLLEALTAVGATGKAGECHRVVVDGTLYIAFGLGVADEIDDEAVRRGVGVAARSLSGVDTAAVSAEFGVGPVVEGLLLGSYCYHGFKSAEAAEHAQVSTEITVVDADAQAFETAHTIAESVNLARDLVNTPANYLYPAAYAKIMEEVGTQAGLTVEVFDEDYLAEHGFGGITAVGGGSQRPPRLVHLALNPEAAGTHTALVGKGITFDTGGISLKPGAKM